jgi:hypothetical protein
MKTNEWPEDMHLCHSLLGSQLVEIESLRKQLKQMSKLKHKNNVLNRQLIAVNKTAAQFSDENHRLRMRLS